MIFSRVSIPLKSGLFVIKGLRISSILQTPSLNPLEIGSICNGASIVL